MARYIAKRLGLAVITLFLLSVIVFAAAQVLPGDVGRTVLGPLAGQRQSNSSTASTDADAPPSCSTSTG